MSALSIAIYPSISEIPAGVWDGLDHGPSPFLRHGFLDALEVSGSIGERTGWLPLYLLARDGDDVRGGVAAFVKTDSYGEYIFDWGWARSAQRSGVPYYPKLVVAAPVTPATGPRLLVAPGADRTEVVDALVAGVMAVADRTDVSSVHWLFCTGQEQGELVARGFAARSTFQFHWHNDGYECFDDFLAALKSRKRKQLRKERRRALEGIEGIDFVAGADLSPADLRSIDRFYRGTVRDHGGIDYLRPGFFEALQQRMPEAMLFGRARAGGETVAGAIYLHSDRALYGRYWGADVDAECLHFEVAYYSGIELCIERGIPLFEAGAQGEHKLLRGFRPTPTFSAHWIRHPGLDEAIREFLREEALMVAQRMRGLSDYLPYRSDDDGAGA